MTFSLQNYHITVLCNVHFQIVYETKEGLEQIDIELALKVAADSGRSLILNTG